MIEDRNKHYRIIVEQIEEETGITATRIRSAIRHFFNYQREEFQQLNYASYYWPFFGTFTYFNHPKRGDYYREADIYRGIEPKPDNKNNNENGLQESADKK